MSKLKSALILVCLSLVVTLLKPSTLPETHASDSSPEVSNVFRIATLTGDNSLNATASNYDLQGTDLGIMWDNGRGQIMLAFGDSYGKGWGGCGAGPRDADWRSNLLAFSSDKNPANGLHFSTMVQDSPNHAKEVLTSRKVTGLEETVIPTAGISVGTRNYLYYMSVKDWGEPGHWQTNYAGIAYSDDNGQNWVKSDTAKWPNNTSSWNDKFQQVAVVKNNGYVYMFGTPNGRFGNAYLARVPEDQLLSKGSYQYWDGSTWQTGNEGAAVPVVAGPVAELSVQYNSYFGRWLMTYLDETRHWLILREAADLTGPWSGQKLLVSATDYPQLYGGFIHPWFNNSPNLYFTMSQWCAPDTKYNVNFMHATLDLNLTNRNLLSDGGFEEQQSEKVSSPWQTQGSVGIDVESVNAYKGLNNAWLRAAKNGSSLYQTLAVLPNHTYTLSAWVKTGGKHEAILGVKTISGDVINEVRLQSSVSYNQQTVTFNSGPHSLIQVYAGLRGTDTNSWINLDEVALTPR